MLKIFWLFCESYFFPQNSIPFRASELALPRNSECSGISTFFRGITETIPSLFRGICSERNSVPNPTCSVCPLSELGPPISSPACECVPLLPKPSCDGTHSPAGEGVVGPNSDDWSKSYSVLSMLEFQRVTALQTQVDLRLS